MIVKLYPEAATGNRPLCLSNASGVGSRPRNCTKTCIKAALHVQFKPIIKMLTSYSTYGDKNQKDLRDNTCPKPSQDLFFLYSKLLYKKTSLITSICFVQSITHLQWCLATSKSKNGLPELVSRFFNGLCKDIIIMIQNQTM